MKRLALVAVVLVAACSTKETPKADTAAPAMAPAPAPAMSADTGIKKDSASAAAKMDTAMKKTDTAMKKMDQAKDAMKGAAKAKKP
jgi:hypothetical protein